MDPKSDESCRLEPEEAPNLRGELPAVVAALVASCQAGEGYAHLSPAPMPSEERAIEVIQLARRVLFPGYFHPQALDQVSLSYTLGQETARLFDLVAELATGAVRHECLRHGLSCSQCARRGQEAALALVRSLPGLRRVLAGDIQAALDGDPAAHGPDEVICSYPGFFAVTVHRLAHELNLQGVPILPRVMSEYAHHKTGIDIHPGASIGGSFFIDHGTGVVIGQTTLIGDRVRLYQGVTLGALSLPPDAGRRLKNQKRHPTIEDDVIVYSGATILGGGTLVGARSVIGGNVWLTESVPPDSKVMMKTPELVYLGRPAVESQA